MRRNSFARPKASRLVLCLSSMLLVSACGKLAPESEDSLLDKARAQEAKGDYAAAVVVTKNILQKNPNNVEARLLLADAYVRTGYGKEAEIALTQARELGASDEAVAVNFAKALLLQGNYKQLLVDVVPLPTQPPATQARILCVRGEAQISTGQFKSASDSYDAAVKLDPLLPDALIGQARILLARGKIAEADARLQQVLDRSPNELGALLIKAESLRAQKKYDDAKTVYEQILKLDPANLVAHSILVALEISKGNFDAAAKHVTAVKNAQGSGSMGLYYEAFLDYNQKNYVAAQEPIQKVLIAAPDHVPSLVLAGAISYALGRDEEAQRHLQRALTAAPNLMFARRMYIAASLRQGQMRQAIDAIEAAVKLAPNDAAMLAIAADVYVKAGDFKTATAYLQRAATLDPKNIDLRRDLGVSRLASGDTDRALSDLEEVVVADKEDYRADLVLIVGQVQKKDYAAAAKSVERLAAKQPNNPVTYNLKGGLLQVTGDRAGARAAFEKALALDPRFFVAAVNLARMDVDDRKPQDAIKRFQTMIDKEPGNTAASMALYELQVRQGAKPAELQAILDRSIAAKPSAYEPLLAQSKLLLATEPKLALAAANKAYALAPGNAAVVEALGAAQLENGEEAGALTSYGKAVELQPRNAKVMIRYAALLGKGNPPAAQRILVKALEIEPDNIEAASGLVALRLKDENVAEALKLARHVQAVAPTSSLGPMLEGDALMVGKTYAKAAAAFEKGYTLDPNGALAIKMHAAYVASGRVSIADQRMQDWLKRSPDDLQARYYLASSAQQRGDLKMGIAQYQAILEKDPSNAFVLNDLAVSYQRAGDPRMVATAEKAYQLASGQGPIADTLGWILVNQGQEERGIQLLRTAAKEIPAATEIRMHLVHAYLKVGDKRAARDELERLVNLRGNFQERAAAEKLLAELKEAES